MKGLNIGHSINPLAGHLFEQAEKRKREEEGQRRREELARRGRSEYDTYSPSETMWGK